MLFYPRLESLEHLPLNGRCQEHLPGIEKRHSVGAGLRGCVAYLAALRNLLGGMQVERPEHARRRQYPSREHVRFFFNFRAVFVENSGVSFSFPERVSEENVPEFVCDGKPLSPGGSRIIVYYQPFAALGLEADSALI